MSTHTAPRLTSTPATERHDIGLGIEQDAYGFLDHRTRSATTGPATAGPGRHLVFEDDFGERLLPLDRPITHLGRGLVADVRIEHPSISRHHALIVERGGRCTILDDRSLNGTFVNGRAIDRAELRDLDVIRVGSLVMRFRQIEDPSGRRRIVDRATLAETAMAAAGGGTVSSLRRDPAATELWRAALEGPRGERMDIAMDVSLGVVTVLAA